MNIDSVCRLCGAECHDLIDLFENINSERNLITTIKKYIRVTVYPQDGLPHHVCGPCVAKLDELVGFIDHCLATQKNLQDSLKDSSSNRNAPNHEIDPHMLIQDVKIEPEEMETEINNDDPRDEDYDPHNNKCRKVCVRGELGSSKSTRGSRGRWPSKPKRKMLVPQVPGNIVKDNEDVKEGPFSTHIYIGEDSKQIVKINDCKDDGREVVAEEKLEEVMSGTSSVKEFPVGNAGNITFRCCICRDIFSSIEQHADHCYFNHENTKPRYMCPQCPKSFSRIPTMLNHQQRKHQDTLQRCPKCSKCYSAHYLWTRHMLVHTNTRPFPCDECTLKFKSKSELKSHKKIHNPNEDRYTHCCEVCGKRFTQKANLDVHLRQHTGDRPFSCEFCGKGFHQKSNMEEHRRMHTGEKPFVCDLCGVSYSRQGQLRMHQRTHTGEKPHECQFCEKKFIRRESLKKHERIHTDTRPYKCSYCEKYFRDQGKKRIHERLHTGERPYKCQVCGRGFCESGNLRKHFRVHKLQPGTEMLASSSSVQGHDSSLLSIGADPTIISSKRVDFNMSSVAQPVELVADSSLMVVPENVGSLHQYPNP